MQRSAEGGPRAATSGEGDYRKAITVGNMKNSSHYR